MRSLLSGVALAIVGIVVACSASDEQGSSSSSHASAGGATTTSAGGSGGGFILTGGSAGMSNPDLDTDGDGIPDEIEGTGDSDGDGLPNYNDPINNGPPPAVTLIAISTTFNSPIGIDYHEPTNSIVMSVNYPIGVPTGFERIEFDGQHQQFSTLSGLTEEVKIATARSNNPQGFVTGDLFVGNGIDGQIVRIHSTGATVDNPWVDLPGSGNGLMRGSLYVDRTGEWGGDLVVVTTSGQVWRVNVAGVPTPVATVGVHLEGLVVVPNKPARFGPLAGKLIAGAEEQGLLYSFDPNGSYVTYPLGVNIEDIDIISPKENFFGVNFGSGRLLGAEAAQFVPMMGDILLTSEDVVSGQSELFRLNWDGAQLVAQPIPLGAGSAAVSQWEHVTFAPAGVAEIPPVPR